MFVSPRLLLLSALLVSALQAQPNPAPAAANDALGRGSPRQSMIHFLEACHARDYQKATHYLDLRQIPLNTRAADGPELARQLEDLLDDTPFDIATLSLDPEGDQSDGLLPGLERLQTLQVDGNTIELQLQRSALKGGLTVWLVSADSVRQIPTAHKIVAESPFEKRLPQQLVTFEVLDTPAWRWIALALLALLVWLAAGLISWALAKTAMPLVREPGFRSPFRAALAIAGFGLAMELTPPSALPRLFLGRVLGLGLALALAWAASVMVDVLAKHWSRRLDPRMQAVKFSVLPLGVQMAKLALFLLAILTILNNWGYNTSTILAGLGVGGLAVALAAQKTIENLFGGISVIGDRPVLVGDVCRFGDHTGTVTHIGLRSTRIRTGDRTIISVPNGQFSSMTLENISSRDKIWFHHTLNLRRNTTSAQLLQLLDALRQILAENPIVEAGKIPVRFIGVGTYSLDVEVGVYVKTTDYDEFLALQQELLIRILQAIERAGTSLAVPVQESLAGSSSASTTGFEELSQKGTDGAVPKA